MGKLVYSQETDEMMKRLAQRLFEQRVRLAGDRGCHWVTIDFCTGVSNINRPHNVGRGTHISIAADDTVEKILNNIKQALENVFFWETRNTDDDHNIGTLYIIKCGGIEEYVHEHPKNL